MGATVATVLVGKLSKSFFLLGTPHPSKKEIHQSESQSHGLESKP